MKNIRRILILAVFILSVFNCSAMADVAVDERGNITADVVYDMSEFGYWKKSGDDAVLVPYEDLLRRYVGVMCLRSDEEIGDLSAFTQQEIADMTVYIGSTFVDADGSASLSFRMPSRSGKYTVAFINKALGIQLQSFDFVSRMHFEYNDSVADGAEGVLGFINANKDVLPLNIIGYDMLNDEQKMAVAGILFETGEVDTSDKLNENIASLPVEKMIFEQFEAEDVLAYIEKCNENSYSFFATEITDVFVKKLSYEAKLDIVSGFTGNEFTEEKQDEFEFGTLKAYIDSFEYFTGIEDVIKDENNIWGFSEKSLEKYDKIKNKNDVMTEMLDEIANVSGVEEYAESFDRIVSEQYDDEKTSSGGSSGSGSSGGGGGGKKTSGGGGFGIKVDSSVASSVLPGETVQPSEAVAVSFDDMKDFAWAKEAVDALTEAGIVNGVSENSFAPSLYVKREEFAKMIAGALKLTGIDYDVEFDDVDKASWYYAPVCALVREKIVNGISLTRFGVGSNITREDMAVILGRVYDLKKLTLEKKLSPSFTDEEAIAGYALESVNKLAGLGIISGYKDGSFKPQAPLTRAEAATVIYRFFNEAGLLN